MCLESATIWWEVSVRCLLKQVQATRREQMNGVHWMRCGNAVKGRSMDKVLTLREGLGRRYISTFVLQ